MEFICNLKKIEKNIIIIIINIMNNKNNKIITANEILYLLNKYNNSDDKINIYNIYLNQRAFATQLFIEEQKKLEEINEDA